LFVDTSKSLAAVRFEQPYRNIIKPVIYVISGNANVMPAGYLYIFFYIIKITSKGFYSIKEI